MGNWYTSREGLKAATNIQADFTGLNSTLDDAIETASREVENLTHRFFIPKLQTRYYSWPQRDGRSGVLYLDADLIAVVSLKTKGGATTIAPTDYFLEPVNDGPPFDKIETDDSKSAEFEAGSTSQRAIQVDAKWGYNETLEAVGTVTSGLSGSAGATAFVCSTPAAIEVGDTLLIDSEAIFVSDRIEATPQNLTVERAANGTTAAIHADGATIRKYVVPGDIRNLCNALAIAYFHQGKSGWTGQIGGGDGVIETRLSALFRLREKVKLHYGRFNLELL